MRLFSRSRIDLEMEEELRAHIAMRADDLERSGLPRAEAERRARVEFGARERVREECREAAGGAFFETLLRDGRFSLRVLRKSPGFTLVAVATLALAIAANSVVFGVMDGLILNPIDVPRPDSLYAVQRGRGTSESHPNFRDLRERNHSFEDLAAFTFALTGVDTGQTVDRTFIQTVSGNYFDALGVRPHLGRLWRGSEVRGPNSAPYVVLSHAYWRSHFGGDPNVIGRVIRLNKHPFTIVGVTPPGFRGTLAFFATPLFAPLVHQEQLDGEPWLDARGSRALFMVIGHLKKGVSREQAVADLNAIGADLERAYPKEASGMTFTLARPGLVGDFLGKPVRAFVAGLTLLAALILLAACANLGSLFAARSADRARDVALRLALGAGRIRILRQMITETVIVAMAGGALGVWLGVWLLRLLTAWRPQPRFPVHIPVEPGPGVYVVALALALLAGVLFGLVPVRQVMRTDPYQTLKLGKTGGDGRRITLRDVLLVAQIAICAVLVTSSLVAVRGLARSFDTRLGFDPGNALVVDTDLVIGGYRGARAAEMQKRIVETLEAVPGVRAAGYIDQPPLGEGGRTFFAYRGDAADLRPANAVLQPWRYVVSPGYFAAAATAILAGRELNWSDAAETPRVAVVNREFAIRMFGGIDQALGRHFKLRDGARVEVVGVAEDGKYGTLTENQAPAMFLPARQWPASETWIVVRTHGDPRNAAPAIRDALRTLDDGVPFHIQTWDVQLNFAYFPSRVATLALGVLGLIGAVLAVTGIFGMAAYSVSKRMRELGIRIAIGAQRRQVLQAALGRALKLLSLGSAAGLGLGILAAQVLAAIVYQATPKDPVVLGGVVIAMLLLGLLATWIPARRALSIDPLRLLREE